MTIKKNRFLTSHHLHAGAVSDMGQPRAGRKKGCRTMPRHPGEKGGQKTPSDGLVFHPTGESGGNAERKGVIRTIPRRKTL